MSKDMDEVIPATLVGDATLEINGKTIKVYIEQRHDITIVEAVDGDRGAAGSYPATYRCEASVTLHVDQDWIDEAIGRFS